MVELKVKKKDGKLEDFNLNKIKESLMKAGATVEQAGEVALDVANWVKETSKAGVVTTIDIEQRVVNGIARKNEQVAKAFKNFVKDAI